MAASYLATRVGAMSTLSQIHGLLEITTSKNEFLQSKNNLSWYGKLVTSKSSNGSSEIVNELH